MPAPFFVSPPSVAAVAADIGVQERLADGDVETVRIDLRPAIAHVSAVEASINPSLSSRGFKVPPLKLKMLVSAASPNA